MASRSMNAFDPRRVIPATRHDPERIAGEWMDYWRCPACDNVTATTGWEPISWPYCFHWNENKGGSHEMIEMLPDTGEHYHLIRRLQQEQREAKEVPDGI